MPSSLKAVKCVDDAQITKQRLVRYPRKAHNNQVFACYSLNASRPEYRSSARFLRRASFCHCNLEFPICFSSSLFPALRPRTATSTLTQPLSSEYCVDVSRFRLSLFSALEKSLGSCRMCLSNCVLYTTDYSQTPPVEGHAITAPVLGLGCVMTSICVSVSLSLSVFVSVSPPPPPAQKTTTTKRQHLLLLSLHKINSSLNGCFFAVAKHTVSNLNV